MNNAPTEYEVKFFPINLEEMRQKLQDVRASLKTPERLMRRCAFAADANPGMPARISVFVTKAIKSQ